MTIGEKMTITTWRARQLAYLEEVYSPREHMGKLMSHLGARQVYIQMYNTMRTALKSLPEQPNTDGGLPQAARGHGYAGRHPRPARRYGVV